MILHHEGAPYAHAAHIVIGALQLLRPPTRETVDEYALRRRQLPARSGIGRMPYSHDDGPYLVAPMRSLNSYLYTTVAFVGPGQCGKTTIAENAFLHAVAKQARNILWYMQTDEGVEAYVKKRINQMIQWHDEMSSKLGKDPIQRSLHYKEFIDMTVEFLSATYSNLIGKSAPFIIADEYDAYDPALGDPKQLLDVRRRYYGRLSTLLAISHPDRALGLNPDKDWRNGIMRVYADSTRKAWYWPCPQCRGWSSPVPTEPRVMTLEWPHDAPLDVIQREAHLLCPINGCIVHDRERKAMNLAAFRSPHGGWIGQGQEIDEGGTVRGELIPNDTDGYWAVGVMSDFLLNGIGDLARAMSKAEKEFEVSGDPKTLKEVTVKDFGFPYTARGPQGSVDAETLAERARDETQPLGIVPEGVRVLFCWIDLQAAHAEVLVRGFGIDGESWIIDKLRVPFETSTDRKAWFELLSGLIAKRYPLATDAKRGMAIRGLGYDSGGAPGVTDRAYEVWRKLKKESLTRLLGKTDGRDVWTVLPTKGSGNLNAPKLSVVYPDNQKKDKKIARSGTVPLALFNANGFKDDLGGQLMHRDPGPGFVHIPAALRSAESPHVNFEQLVSEQRDNLGKWEKPHQGVRNEMLDLMVGTDVIAHLHGLHRMVWTAPKVWAAEWDKNSTIVPLDEVAAAKAATARPKRSISDLLG